MTNKELIKALRECEYCNVCSIAVDGDCPFGGRDALEVAAADALEAADKRIAELEKRTKLPDRQEFLAKGSFIEEPLSRPKEGEWIIDGMNEYELSYGCVGYEPIYRCSKCGITTESYLRTERPIMPEDADFPNYCPNCGARMNHKYCDVVNGCVMCDVELCNGKENRNERNETETVSVLRRIRAH